MKRYFLRDLVFDETVSNRLFRDSRHNLLPVELPLRIVLRRSWLAHQVREVWLTACLSLDLQVSCGDLANSLT